MLGAMHVACGRPQATTTLAAPAAAWQRQQRHRRQQQLPPPQRPPVSRRPLQPVGAAAVDYTPASIDIESLVYENGCYTVQGCLVHPGSPDTVYQVLTAYEDLPRVFHNIDSSTVRTDPATGRKQLVQTCKWAFLVFSGTFVTELNVREDAVQRQLEFSLIESAFMREFVGSWDVQRAPNGSTQVRHRLSVRPSVAPPQRIGELTCKIFRSQVVGLLEDLQEELDDRL